MDSFEVVKAVRAIAKGEPPNVDISEILLKHNCIYLLSKLKAASLITAANMLAIKERYNACMPLFADLMDFDYAVIKGAVLSKSAYGNICYRNSSDIDLLISRDNVEEIKNYLLQNGFIQGRIVNNKVISFTRQEILYHTALSHQTAPFLKRTDGRFCPIVNIDVNMDIFWGESKRHSDMTGFLKNTEVVDICGVAVKKLTPVAEFISLCMHHYKDMNSIYLLSQGSLKLNLLCDIYFYLVNNRLEIDELKRFCIELDVTEYVYLCIAAANEIFDDEVLLPYLMGLDSDKAQAIQNSFGLDDSERKGWNIDFAHRLFDDDFYIYFQGLLTRADFEKIQTNEKYML